MVLGAIPYCTNRAQLHTDESVLPRHRRARASWNYLVTPDRDNVLVTYDVTRLMRLAGPRRFLVTLGGRDRVDPATVLAEMTYNHPLYTPESVAAQRLLPTLNDDRVVFAGRLSRLGIPRGRRGVGAAGGATPRRRRGHSPTPATGGGGMLTPALYRTRITHLRRAPVHHYFEHRSYSWYVDIDRSAAAAAVAAAVRPVRRPRSLRRRAERHTAATSRRVPGRPRHRPARRHRHRAAAGQGARLRLQPAEPVLVPRRRRRAAPRRRRGTQHLRRPARLSAATRRRHSPRW